MVLLTYRQHKDVQSMYRLLTKQTFVDEANSHGRKQNDKWGEMRRHKKVISIVNPTKYANYPRLKNVIPNFNSLNMKDILEILHDWNWLGYGNPYDFDGDDFTGFDLNKKGKSNHIFKRKL